MNRDLENWDPMYQDFDVGKTYEEGPGADLVATKEAEQNEEAIKIILKNLPKTLTVEGIRNLCLSAGEPSSVIFTPGSDFAVVTFKTIREAELAIRDLNNTPPYYLKAKFMLGDGNDCKSNEDIQETKCDEGGVIDSFYKCPPSDKQYLNEKLKGKTMTHVPPYFQVFCEHDDPSLIMRQKKLDFKTKKECISMGRGYINVGDLNRYKYESRKFSVQSDNWSDSDCETTRCDYCGSNTFRNYGEDYCSNICENKVKSNADSGFKSTIFDYFVSGAFGWLNSLKEHQDGLIKCCIVLDKEYDRYERISKFDQEVDEISAKKGDRVMIFDSNGQIQRGVVCSDQGDFYRVTLIDCGETISVETVYRLPDDLQKEPSFGGVARFSTDHIPYVDPVRFCVKERQVLGSWLCDIINDNSDVIGEVLLEEWSVPGSWTPIPLKSGCRVVITSYKDMKTVFVRRIDGSWNEDFIRLSNDVAGYSLQGKKYAKLPKLDEMCSARYKNDGCFYRAVVRSVRRKSAWVMFTDYGNEQETELEDLRYLPNRIRQVHCFAARVRLKGGSEMSSPETVNYLNQLTAYGRELHLKVDNGEVILTDEASGEVVNDVISELVRPVWEKDSTVFIKSGDTYFLDSIDELEFHPGETEDIFVMNVDAEEFATSGMFWATQNRSDYLGHLNGELKQRITEYCHCLADDQYLPRKGELCLVEFQGDWYRGVSLDDKNSPYLVFLIDFGISFPAETKQMRKILWEFLEMPALALSCIITGFKDLRKHKREEISEYMMEMNKKLLRSVNILRKVDDVYEVSVKELLEL